MQSKSGSPKPLHVIILIIAGTLLLGLGVWFGKDYKSTPVEKTEEFPAGTVLEVPIPLLPFSLIDHDGNAFTESNLLRKWTFFFFGYTNCPDVCPAALVDMNSIYLNLVATDDLTEKNFNVGTQFVFVSVDPQRDTVGTLKEYVPFFNERFIGLTGDADVIASVARPLGVAYSRVPAQGAERDYLVDHSASILLIDPLGRMRAVFPPPHKAVIIADDFRKIRDRYTRECCISGNEKSETVIFDYRKEKK